MAVGIVLKAIPVKFQRKNINSDGCLLQRNLWDNRELSKLIQIRDTKSMPKHENHDEQHDFFSYVDFLWILYKDVC